MKKTFLSMLAISISLSAPAGLQKIDEAHFYIVDNQMNVATQVFTPDLIKTHQGNVNDGRFGYPHNTQNLVLNSVPQAPMQTLASALPQAGADGVKVQIPPQVISYGTINMSMGDIANGSVFTKLPEPSK